MYCVIVHIFFKYYELVKFINCNHYSVSCLQFRSNNYFYGFFYINFHFIFLYLMYIDFLRRWTRLPWRSKFRTFVVSPGPRCTLGVSWGWRPRFVAAPSWACQPASPWSLPAPRFSVYRWDYVLLLFSKGIFRMFNIFTNIFRKLNNFLTRKS